MEKLASKVDLGLGACVENVRGKIHNYAQMIKLFIENYFRFNNNTDNNNSRKLSVN